MGLGFGIWGRALEFRVEGLGFRVQGVGFGVWGSRLGFGAEGLGFRVWRRLWGLVVRVWG